MDKDQNYLPFTTHSGGKYFKDGSYCVPILFEPSDAVSAAKWLGGVPGKFGALTIIEREAAQTHQRKKFIEDNTPHYGHFAQIIDESGFWCQLKVLKAVACERTYIEWCRLQPCAINKDHQGGWDMIKGEMRSEYDHVNTAKNAGTAYKNQQYFGWPLCYDCHHVTKVGVTMDIESKTRLIQKHQFQWARGVVKKQFGFDSWRDIHPSSFLLWVKVHQLQELIPEVYFIQSDKMNQEVA